MRAVAVHIAFRDPGDTLAGAFLAAVAQGLSEAVALRRAVGAAARFVTQPGLGIPAVDDRR